MQKVGGSNPSAPTKNSSVFRLFNTEMVDIAQLVARQVVALKAVGSNPIIHPIQKESLAVSRLFVFSVITRKETTHEYLARYRRGAHTSK